MHFYGGAYSDIKYISNLLNYTNEESIRVIPLDYKEFIKDIKNSYKKEQDVFEQLAKDIPRMNYS